MTQRTQSLAIFSWGGGKHARARVQSSNVSSDRLWRRTWAEWGCTTSSGSLFSQWGNLSMFSNGKKWEYLSWGFEREIDCTRLNTPGWQQTPYMLPWGTWEWGLEGRHRELQILFHPGKPVPLGYKPESFPGHEDDIMFRAKVVLSPCCVAWQFCLPFAAEIASSRGSSSGRLWSLGSGSSHLLVIWRWWKNMPD